MPQRSVPLDINVSLSADSPSFDFLSFLEPYQDSLSLAQSLGSNDLESGGQMSFGPEELIQDASALSFSRLLEEENDDIEDIIRQSDPGLGPWNFQIAFRAVHPYPQRALKCWSCALTSSHVESCQ
jgi:hypothetical protein